MININKKVSERISNGIKRFQPILQSAKTRDVNESDTVIIITDMLSYLFGYDKYTEITSEFAIRGTYCDLAIKIDSKVELLIEVKAIGLELKEAYAKQAIDYAANQGIDWVLLTNGVIWRVYKVTYGKPIGNELVIEIDFLNINFKSTEHLEQLFFISKEGLEKECLSDYHIQKQTLSRYFLAELIQGDAVLECIRRELKKISPDVKITTDQIKKVITMEVLKREALEGEKAEEAKRRVAKTLNKINKAKLKNVTPIQPIKEAEPSFLKETDLDIEMVNKMIMD